ncbi:hypothetical protein L2E82_02286 [Cichorium intybus]|uniref:Uncharacterized protein n=2 Tax=Cichorium intybus TaxID=13427 RepID=A0ACB9GDV7_CICIN|nr:hypothetical protein L2E82_11285 [Cichorium intybus]KAI3789489.1 hypothetical protein L2E82_02286 [Cichorium intybus]
MHLHPISPLISSIFYLLKENIQVLISTIFVVALTSRKHENHISSCPGFSTVEACKTNKEHNPRENRTPVDEEFAEGYPSNKE